MSAAVAPIPGADRARIATWSRLLIVTAFAIGIVGGVTLATAVAKGPAAPAAPAAAAPAPAIATAMDSYLTYRATQSDQEAALVQHDARQAAAFRQVGAEGEADGFFDRDQVADLDRSADKVLEGPVEEPPDHVSYQLTLHTASSSARNSAAAGSKRSASTPALPAPTSMARSPRAAAPSATTAASAPAAVCPVWGSPRRSPRASRDWLASTPAAKGS